MYVCMYVGFCDIQNNQLRGKCYHPRLKTITSTLIIIADITKTKSNNFNLVFLPCGGSLRCRYEADTSSAAGRNKGIDRNRKPRKRSLWYPGALKGIKQKK